MYAHDQQLGNLKSFLAKTRKLVHKLAPRELSPTRLLEKYATDTKKKNASKLATFNAQTQAQAQAADAALAARIQSLQSATLPGAQAQSFAAAPVSVPATAASADTASSINPLIVGGIAVAGALALYLLTRKKRS